MNGSAAEILGEALELSAEARVAIADTLIKSLDAIES